MLEYPQDPNLPPGTWKLWTVGKRRILFSCPKCGETGLLNHEIADDQVRAAQTPAFRPGISGVTRVGYGCTPSRC
jgi:predicted  nucleic acid-binding Zn-ribbon protein